MHICCCFDIGTYRQVLNVDISSESSIFVSTVCVF